jgi:hypothetical protein
LGLEKMKEAMWKVDPSGRFQFSSAPMAQHPAAIDTQSCPGMCGAGGNFLGLGSCGCVYAAA